MKKKVIIVSGGPLVGKSTFIQSNYSGEDKYFLLDYAKEFLALKGGFKELANEEVELEVMEALKSSLMTDVFEGDKTLVLEFCIGFENADELLVDLIKRLKANGFAVKYDQLECDHDEVMRRSAAVQDSPTYFSSYHLNAKVLELLNDIK